MLDALRVVKSPEHLRGRRAFCVGDRTAEAAERGDCLEIGLDSGAATGVAARDRERDRRSRRLGRIHGTLAFLAAAFPAAAPGSH